MASFTSWINMECSSARYALYEALRQKDHLLYIEGPATQNEYMVKIGYVEQDAMKEELDAMMLQRKVELIQTAMNRRGPIDLKEIEKQVEQEKQNKLNQFNGSTSGYNQKFANLSDEERDTLNKVHKAIIQEFHPATHPELTDTQKELYEKAEEAFRNYNLEQLTVIKDMLKESRNLEMLNIKLEIEIKVGVANTNEKPEPRIPDDYTLAKKLYPAFVKTEEDIIAFEKIDSYNCRRNEVEEEMTAIRKRFPHNAKETLESEEKTKAYLENVALRKQRALDRQKELEHKLSLMVEEVENGR